MYHYVHQQADDKHKGKRWEESTIKLLKAIFGDEDGYYEWREWRVKRDLKKASRNRRDI